MNKNLRGVTPTISRFVGRVPAREARQNPSPKLQNSHFWLELAPFQGGLGVPERLGKRYFNFIRHCKRLRNIVSDLKKRLMGLIRTDFDRNSIDASRR